MCLVLRPGVSISGLRHVPSSFTEGVSEQDGGSTLQRVAVTREDSGTYVCWAENRVGRVQAVSFVHVKGEARTTWLFSRDVLSSVYWVFSENL